MNKRTTTTALALTGAVALASGAYAIGSQGADGSAQAANAKSKTATSGQKADHGPRDGKRLDALAAKLGVSSATLKSAIDAVRNENKPADPRTEMTAALAAALGVSTEKVTSAFDQLKTTRQTAMATELAKALGLSTDKVQAALEKLKPTGKPGEPGQRGDHKAKLTALATELGVSEAALKTALETVRPGGPDKGGPGGPGHKGPGGHRGGLIGGPAGAADLAKALGVTDAQLQAAVKKLRTADKAGHAAQRTAMVAALAKKLNRPEATVKAALGSMPGPGGRGHHRP